MSRIGKIPVNIPENVEVIIKNNLIIVKGPLGSLDLSYPEEILLTVKDNKIYVYSDDSKLWGTYRSLIEQLVIGVSEGYTYNLELIGVGYKAFVENTNLILKVGYSHSIIPSIPKDISITCRKPTYISIFGINKYLVTQQAAKIRDYNKPEPYKGKGIIYENELIYRKEGKKK